MNVTIHQPQYLPWLPYFLKIEESDLFIFLDSVDFQKNGLQNRNQIKSAQGLQWLTIPVRQQLGQKIQDVQIDNKVDWRRKHWQTLRHSYGKARAYSEYEKELENLYAENWMQLNDINIHSTNQMLRWLDIRTPTMRSSQMRARGSASELILNLCLEVGASRYVSGTGGMNYLNSAEFSKAGIEIVYRPAVTTEKYPQVHSEIGFVGNLSALDIILNCGKAWRNYLPHETKTT
jgi:hypothetical protein